jgi:hypothetical protein
MLRLTFVVLASLCAVGCAQRPAPAPAAAVIKVGGAGTEEAPCFVEADGVRMPLDRFTAMAGRWRGREVHLEGNAEIPYRCVGGVIFALERARAARIGFIAVPPEDQAR